MATQRIRLDCTLIGKAKILGNALSRSPEKLIEHWINMSQIVENKFG